MERKKIFDILDIISLVLIIPVLLLGIFCSLLMFSAKQNNGVPSMFGYSVVTIDEDIASEEHPDFTSGTKVLTRSVNAESLTIGDYISFYEYVPTVDGEEAEPSDIKFRRIIEVYEQVDEETNAVTYFYSTGDVEGNRDEYTDSEGATRIAYISSDYVIGIYSQTGGFLVNLYSFCASTTGVICLVVLPAAVVLALAAVSLVEQIVRSSKEKKENRKRLIESEKLLQGEALATAGNMNLNSNVPPKAPAGAVPPKAPQAASTNAVPPKAPPPTPPKAPENKAATPSKPAAAPKAAPPVKAEAPKAAKTTAKAEAPKAAKTTAKAAPAKPAAAPKAAPAKPATPPPKPTDKK
ncbi:MAG TPA: hypothetical protein IAA62_03425 [Candidatus Caccopulliclostridium gallistercoris]|uniref:Signal peptidase I n=1 Tax=Candidatus Caccopulliclostridium gallistercoris TaxID=2840719 RepID=A0A9D1SZB9_9FIRM|nr:hypothetical protein [Candidatus Caccopulliclostridium gallistercoris]